MNIFNRIVIFENDKCFLSMLRGYCYVNNIALTELDFNVNGINEIEKLKPDLIVVPLNLVTIANKNFETGLLKRVSTRDQIKICALNNNLTDIISLRLLNWIDVIITNPLNIGEIDEYIKKTFLTKGYFIEKRRYKERRSVRERRNIEYFYNDDNGYRATQKPGYQFEPENPEFKDFQIDHRNRCLVLKGQKVDLTPKEFELIELLLTDVDRIFMTDEIIKHLWPESNRATKSDLYQYMHLLRKKIEENPNNPQWILNVKGFGYKLNVSKSSVHDKNQTYGSTFFPTQS